MKKGLLLLIMMFFGVCVLSAQSDYNYQRRSLFEVLPVTSDDIVFLGNSITDGAEWGELFGGDVHIKNRGISGDRVRYLGERLDPIISGHPKKVFLMIGINDVSDKMTPDDIVAATRAIVLRFRQESPETELFIQSMLPINPNKPRMAKSVARGIDFTCVPQINSMLRQMCSEYGLTFLDICSVLSDKDGNLDEQYTNDGLHLLGTGYLAWRDYLLEYVRR